MDGFGGQFHQLLGQNKRTVYKGCCVPLYVNPKSDIYLWEMDLQHQLTQCVDMRNSVEPSIQKSHVSLALLAMLRETHQRYYFSIFCLDFINALMSDLQNLIEQQAQLIIVISLGLDIYCSISSSSQTNQIKATLRYWQNAEQRFSSRPQKSK